MKRVPLRRRLLLLVAAGLLPLAITSGIALYVLYVQQRDEAERTGLEVARALSITVDAEIRRTTSVLEALATSESLREGNLEAFHASARRVHATQPGWNTVILIDRDMRPLLNTAVPAGTPLPPLLETETAARVVRDGVAVVGALAKGPLGNWGFPVRVPVMHEGTVRHALTAIVNPSAILAVLERTRVPGGWVVAVSDAKGIRVARTVSSRETLGTPFTPTLAAMMASGDAEGTGVTLNSEGVPVFTAYTREPKTGWVTAVGLPVAGVEAAARRSFVTFGGGIALSIALGALAALLIARSVSQPMEQLRDAALNAAREPLRSPETDIREIQDVAHALAESAQERARSDAEREDLYRSEQAARASAEAANRAKDEFLAMLGHELRNPLGAISNAAALLENPAVDGAVRENARGIISRQVSHLARLTDDLLDAGRAVMGKIVLQRRPVDLAAVVRQGLATLATSGRSHNHMIVLDADSAWVDADAVRIDQILSNLVVNAAKYSAPGSAIRVSVKRQGGQAVLRVIDSGIGIPAELAPRVFDLFVQGDRPLDRSSGGLGIGLTLVRRLAELHAGGVEMFSAGEGQGSEFVVRLPAIEAPARVVPEDATARERVGRDILVVEDNDDARETLRMLLEFDGHRVLAEPDGESGLATAIRERPDVMLVDVGLPRIDGYEVARRVRAIDGWGRRPFLIAITGYGQDEDRDRALAAGFDGHLTKPVEPKRLLDAIAALGTTSPSSPS